MGSHSNRSPRTPRKELSDESYVYYRPVLQPTNLNGKALRVVTLHVEGTDYKLITAEDTITPPSINDLTGLPEALKDDCWYNEAAGKYYGSADRIPVEDGTTLTAVSRRLWHSHHGQGRQRAPRDEGQPHGRAWRRNGQL
ncbi:MAG: hypothetical protein V8T00_05985 [Oscillospiraceae bacterium]